jgi:hypothetical protein
MVEGGFEVILQVALTTPGTSEVMRPASFSSNPLRLTGADIVLSRIGHC